MSKQSVKPMLENTLETTRVELPPTQAELPYDDGIPMESQRHKTQMELLIDVISIWLGDKSDGYVGGNMFVYFSLAQIKNKDFRGPDFFVVLGVPKAERRSWVVWEEGKGPDVVIELLSDSTANIDKNEKKLIYQNQLRVPEYFWFDPFNPDDFAGFSLEYGVYKELELNEQNQYISSSLNLALVKWKGEYKGINTTWIRWATSSGELLPSTEDLALQEKQRAEVEKQRAEVEKQRAEEAEFKLLQTARNLLQEGMTVEQVARLTGLSQAQIQQTN